MTAHTTPDHGWTETHCPYCALQCGIRMRQEEPGMLGLEPRDFPTNRGGLCQKGWTAATLLGAPDRITAPLVRNDSGELVEATWDEAYARIVDAVRSAQAVGGPDAVALFGGGGLTNEKAYTLGKFARVALGTSRVDYNGRFCMSSAAAAGTRAFGIDRGLPFPLTDLTGAGAILLVGSNLSETMPPAVQHLSGVRERGGLIVVDPRRTATAALTESGGGIHLQPLPGSDVAVLLGLLHLVTVGGDTDDRYMAERVTGWTEVRAAVTTWWPERVERHTGVPVDRLRAAAAILAAARPGRGGSGAYVLTGRGAEQHAHGTDTVTAAINLSLALGLPGRVGSGYGCITGQGNGQGGREHGQKADQLPGYRSIVDPAAREHVAAVWGIPPASIPGPGLPAVELIEAIGEPDGPRVLFVHGANPVVSAPHAVQTRQKLAALDLLVVADFVPSETAQLADVVLPVPQWAEEDGTMTSLEGRVLRRRRVIPPPDGVRDELRIWHDLARLLDAPSDFAADAAAALEELVRASAGGPADYTGVDLARLDAGEALHWPCPTPGHAGTPRLFLDGFGTPDGRARMIAVDVAPVADDVRDEAPIYLITGRILQQYQSGAQTRRVPDLVRAEPRAFIQLHPSLAARLGIEEGDTVRVTSTRGSACGMARLSNDIRRDTVFMPFHFPGAQAVNEVTNSATDPISGMPEFKVCAVQVARANANETVA